MFEDRRRYERVPFLAEATIYDSATGTCWRGRSIDLSQGGIGLYCERFVPTGAHVRLLLAFRHPGRTETVEIDGTVRWARVEDAGGLLGVEFHRPLNVAGQKALCDYLDRR